MTPTPNPAAATPVAAPSSAGPTLVEAARQVRPHAYAPYSGFAVGAALLDEHGRVHVGCNVENAAYPQGLCAEAGALAALVAAGGRAVVEAAVVGAARGPARPVLPCGGCRQKLSEFAVPGMRLWLADDERVLGVRRLDDLLPESFGPRDLGQAEPPR